MFISFRNHTCGGCLAASAACLVLTASAAGAPTDDLEARARAVVGIESLDVVHLDLDGAVVDKEVVVEIPLDGKTEQLVLYPYSVRSLAPYWS